MRIVYTDKSLEPRLEELENSILENFSIGSISLELLEQEEEKESFFIRIKKQLFPPRTLPMGGPGIEGMTTALLDGITIFLQGVNFLSLEVARTILYNIFIEKITKREQVAKNEKDLVKRAILLRKNPEVLKIVTDSFVAEAGESSQGDVTISFILLNNLNKNANEEFQKALNEIPMIREKLKELALILKLGRSSTVTCTYYPFSGWVLTSI